LEEEEETKNVSTYLNALIEEINKLVAHGIVYADEQFDILISSIICDSPAKAFIKNVKQYSSYSGCDKCTKSGTWVGKMTYPETDSVLRTDLDFDNIIDEEHHKGPSPLVGTIGMVSRFPIDYMHLGVVKRLILLWLKGPLNVRLGANISTQISNSLCSLRHHIPSEFARRPRGFWEIDHWKATEYRQFLLCKLYTGPIVLKTLNNERMYTNFMLLSVGLHILLNSHLV
jgi:hypothetical protein